MPNIHDEENADLQKISCEAIKNKEIMSSFVRKLKAPTFYGSSVVRRLGTSTEAGNKERLATIRLYRLLHRASRSFAVDKPSDPILLQPPIEATHWGRHMMFYLPESSKASNIEQMFRLFYTWNDDVEKWYYDVVGDTSHELPPMTSETCWTTPENLQEAIRLAFRTEYSTDATTLTKWSILALQVLEEQKKMWSLSSSEVTEQIRVTATSRCIGTSDPTSHFPPAALPGGLQSKHRFAYRMRIENLSDQHVQLVGRYFHISEEEGEEDPVMVDAPSTGAVGQSPVLRPNQVFEYTSGTDLAKTKGEMKGHFYMTRVTEDEGGTAGEVEKLEVTIAPFPLVAK
jgi:ApaG protein